MIRPTADRVRQTLFNVLGQSCDGLTVLDLYSGTGALGLEAVSRGAVKAVLVDRDREALGLCRLNTDSLKFTHRVEIISGDAVKTISVLAARGLHFELVFADPPYKAEAGVVLLETLSSAKLVSEGGVVVIETAPEESLPASLGGFAQIDRREFGATAVTIFRLTEQGP